MTGGYLTQGKISRVVSTHGTYEVLANIGPRFIFATGLKETASGLYGAHTSSTYPPGTWVILFVPDGSVSGNSLAFILGACNDTPVVKDSPYSILSVLDKTVSFLSTGTLNDIRFVPEDTLMEHDYSNGRASDIIPGEWAKTTYIGGGFLLNDFMSSMSTNERTKIEAFYFKNLLRFTADSLQQRIAANDTVSFLTDGGLNNEVIRRGSTLIESLGGLRGDVPLEATEATKELPYDYTYTTKQPYYSYQKITGDMSQGILETYTVPGQSVDDNNPPGALSIYKGYDGSYAVKALNSISFEKTSIIPVPWAIQDPDTYLPVGDHSDYDPVIYPMLPEIYSFYGADAVTDKNSYDLEKDSFYKFRVRNKIWNIPKDKDAVLANLTNAGFSFKDQPELSALPIEAPYYKDAPVKNSLESFVNDDGVRVKQEGVSVYDMSSCIKQLPDGSITISGGFGEEIRMYRGNVYITCPGDVITQPGRDNVVFAGGNNIQKANRGTTEIEGASVTVISEGNVQVAAGVDGGPATLIIENKSEETPDLSEYENNMTDNKSSGSGVIIKGKAVATISDNIYLQAEGTEDNRLGNSQIRMRSASINSVMEKAVSYLQNGGSYLIAGGRSMLTLGNGTINMVADSGLRLNTGQVLCHSGKITIPFQDINKDEITTTTMGVGDPSQLIVQNGIQTSTVQAENISNNSGQMGTNSPTYSRRFNTIFTKPPPGSGFESYRMDGLPVTTEFVHKKLKEWGIVLPVNRYAKMELPVTRWQKMLSGEPEVWKPIYVKRSFLSDAKTNKADSETTYPGLVNSKLKGSLKKLVKGGTIKEEQLSVDLIINSK